MVSFSKESLTMRRYSIIPIFICLIATTQERPDFSRLIEAMVKDGCTVHEASGVRVCKRDYSVDGKNVEAISFEPRGGGRYPGLLLIPGHATTARDWISNGLTYAGNGYAGLAVSQPGYGKSEGPGDYVGPRTIKVLTEGYRRFQRETFVDGKRMGIVGYSRGGMAASLLAVQLDDVKAAVLGAGVYDFKRQYDDTGLDGIRANMKAETGMTEEAIRLRSSVLQMERLSCPVLILHGEKDINVPVSQAHLLRDRLTALKKEFEIQIFPDREHGISPQNLSSTRLISRSQRKSLARVLILHAARLTVSPELHAQGLSGGFGTLSGSSPPA
jgi:pimeloyl-ACP methyl ester carboxylesterase